MRRSKPERVYRGAGAVILASVFIHFCDRILGVQIEAFTGGIDYFSPWWVVDVFLVPFLAGILVSLIFGYGGKWLAHLPPLIVRSLSYFAIAHQMTAIAPGSSLMPVGWWGFYLILTIEFCAVGGVIGEVMVKRTYGRSTPSKAVEQTGPAPR
jgi:hypothetical protein